MKMKDFCKEAYHMIFCALANRTRLAIIDVLKDGPKSISEISIALEQEEKLKGYMKAEAAKITYIEHEWPIEYFESVIAG